MSHGDRRATACRRQKTIWDLMMKDASTNTSTSAGPSFVFVLNWLDELRRLAPPTR